MNTSLYKNRSIKTLRVLAASLKQRAQAETAYLGNFWAELSSTFLYVVTYVVFIELLFRRAGTIADFSKNDFLFMSLIGQFTFYVVAQFLAIPMYYLLGAVRKGEFDLLLLKPAPTRMLLYASAIRPLYLLMVSLPNIILFCLLIDWGELQLSALSVLSGAIVWVSGLVIFKTLLFVLVYPVFTQGDSTDLMNTWYASLAMTEIPYHRLPFSMKALSFVMLPALLMTAGATQVILMKGASALAVIIPAIIAAALAAALLSVLWQRALRNYTSASS